MDGPDGAAVHLYPSGNYGVFPSHDHDIQSFFQCLLAVLEGKEYDQRHPDEMHDNEAFEDDEGIAESGM